MNDILGNVTESSPIHVKNFLTAKNILAIARRDIILSDKQDERVVISPQYFPHALADWRYFRAMGVLPSYWNDRSELEHDFFAYCSRSNQPFMFITPNEMDDVLKNTLVLPYTFSAGCENKQRINIDGRDYFINYPSDVSALMIYYQPFIRRNAGEMVLGRKFYAPLFLNLDDSLEWITLSFDLIEHQVTVTIANIENHILYHIIHNANDSSGFPLSHLDILSHVSKSLSIELCLEG